MAINRTFWPLIVTIFHGKELGGANLNGRVYEAGYNFFFREIFNNDIEFLEICLLVKNRSSRFLTL